jgi:hypothetical protein
MRILKSSRMLCCVDWNTDIEIPKTPTSVTKQRVLGLLDSADEGGSQSRQRDVTAHVTPLEISPEMSHADQRSEEQHGYSPVAY